MTPLPEELQQYVTHGQEEPYLEYKGDVSWHDKKKKFEIVQTIFALANEKDGGVIVVGVEDNGDIVGLSDENFFTFKHDSVNQFLVGKGNQAIECKLRGFEFKVNEETKKVVVIQVSESKEYPVIYIGQTEKIKDEVGDFVENVGLRKSALYIRNKQNIGNKEIQTLEEWQEVIEGTIKKYQRETIRRSSILGVSKDPYKGELTI